MARKASVDFIVNSKAELQSNCNNVICWNCRDRNFSFEITFMIFFETLFAWNDHNSKTFHTFTSFISFSIIVWMHVCVNGSSVPAIRRIEPVVLVRWFKHGEYCFWEWMAPGPLMRHFLEECPLGFWITRRISDNLPIWYLSLLSTLCSCMHPKCT